MNATHTPALNMRDALRNERLNALDILSASPFIVIVTQYASVLITRLGASPLMLGLLTSGAALVAALMTLLGPRWLERVPSYRASISIPGVLWRCVMLVIPVALLLPGYEIPVIVFGTMGFSVFAGIANFSVTAFLPRMTRRDRLARLMSTRWTWLGVGMAVSTPLIGGVLNNVSMPLNYFIVSAVGLALVMVSLLALLLVRIGPPSENAPTKKSLSLAELRQHPRALRFLLIALGIHTAINTGGPLVTLRMVRELGASDMQFGMYFAIFWLSVALAGLFTSQVIERFGKRNVFVMAMAGFALNVLMLALSATLWPTYLAAVVNGVAMVWFQVSVFGLLVDSAPEGKYEGFSGWNTIVINIAIFIAPLVMTSLIDIGLPVVAGLLLSAGLRALAGGAAYTLLRDSEA